MSEEKKAEVAVQEKKSEITQSVLDKVNSYQKEGGLTLPKDYSVENAIKSAYLILSDQTAGPNKTPVLQVCTKASIANALLNMCVQGLSPMKSQCAFIAYGDKLSMQRQYQGDIALAQRYGEITEVNANVIYEGDVFEYENDPSTGLKKVLKHTQSLGNIDNNKIIGAYAILQRANGKPPHVEIMTMLQIKTSWSMGKGGSTPAHLKFPDQMAMKTVIKRGCKLFIQASSDAALIEGMEKDDSDNGSREKLASARSSAPQSVSMDVEDAEALSVEETPEPPKEVKEEATKSEAPAPKSNNLPLSDEFNDDSDTMQNPNVGMFNEETEGDGAPF